jgi:hypothetical protein
MVAQMWLPPVAPVQFAAHQITAVQPITFQPPLNRLPIFVIWAQLHQEPQTVVVPSGTGFVAKLSTWVAAAQQSTAPTLVLPNTSMTSSMRIGEK